MPENENELARQVEQFQTWYNEERPSGITGITPAEMSRTDRDVDLSFKAERAVDRAERLIEEGKAKDAVKVLKPLLAKDKYLLAAHQQLVHAYVRLEEAKQARQALGAWLEVDPGCPEVYQLLSEIAVHEGDYLLARNWALTGLEVVPDDFDLLVGAAQASRLIGLPGIDGLLARARAADGPRLARFMHKFWIDAEIAEDDPWLLDKRMEAASRALDQGDEARAAELLALIAAGGRGNPAGKASKAKRAVAPRQTPPA